VVSFGLRTAGKLGIDWTTALVLLPIVTTRGTLIQLATTRIQRARIIEEVLYDGASATVYDV
jgi:hypothetical protein